MANKPTKTAAKATGKAKAAGKALKGQSGILRHLAGEHGEVSTLMKRVASSSQESKVRDELFPEIRTDLLAHAKAEEKVFYPAMRKHPDMRELVERSQEQHEKIEGYVEQLADGNKHTKTWMTIFERMMRAVEQHVELEEQKMFPLAKDLCTKEELEDLLERYEGAEQALKRSI
jgi:hemerythrin superfamily protein